MLYDFIKLSLRSIIKQKMYIAVNILGLTASLVVVFLITLYIHDETRYDKYHSNAREIFRLVNVYSREGVGENSSSCPFPIVDSVRKENPGLIKNSVRFFNFWLPQVMLRINDKSFNTSKFFWADSSVLEMFDFELIDSLGTEILPSVEGDFDKSRKFIDPRENILGTVLITESAARNYFGDTAKCLGNVIVFEDAFALKITGILKDIPSQSHFKFDFLASINTVIKMLGRTSRNMIWNPCWTYIELEKNVTTQQVETAFGAYIQKHFDEPHKYNVSYYLQALTDIHLKSKLDYEIEESGSMSNLYILAGIAAFLLVIAVINFVNLSTASVADRAKETALKKVLGVSRKNLAFQYLVQTILLVQIAIFGALIITEFLMPWFNFYTGKNIRIDDYFTSVNILILFTFSVLVGFAGGIYPALYLSGFKPVSILSKTYRQSIKKSSSRKIMVIVQFASAVVLISGTIVIYRQLVFLKNADLGFDKDKLVLLYVHNNPLAFDYLEFKEKLTENPQIESVTGMSQVPGIKHNTNEYTPIGFPKGNTQFFPAMNVRRDFVQTFGIQIVAGKDFSKEKDEAASSILINEKMAEFLGCRDSKDAVGKKFIHLHDTLEVTGILKNFNLTSLRNEIAPFIIHTGPDYGNDLWDMDYVAVRLKSERDSSAIAAIRNTWMNFSPERPFEFEYYEDKINKMYENESVLVKLAIIFTFLATFIASIGLLGLTTVLTEQRTKEIGIRKVFGSSAWEIIRMFSLEFFKLVLLSNVIAVLPTFFVLKYWLKTFAFQTSIPVFVFFLTAFISLLFTLIMISGTTIKAALRKPVVSLRYE